MAEPIDAEVQHLADILADAKLKGVSAGCLTLARMILAAGYRRVDVAEGLVIEAANAYHEASGESGECDAHNELMDAVAALRATRHAAPAALLDEGEGLLT